MTRMSDNSSSNEREQAQGTDLIEFPARAIFDTRQVPMLVGPDNADVSLDAKAKCLDIIRSHCADPTIIKDDGSNVYMWAAEISSDREDYYKTRMDPETSLKNYVEDAIDGTAFLNSHNLYELPSGRSFAGALITDTEGVTKVYAAFYTISDLKLTDLSTD